MRLVTTASDGRIKYKEFGKFLDKRRVRQFKYVQEDSQDMGDVNSMEDDMLKSHRNKSAVELELERPMVKEASLSYILRKSAELHIDLRREFVSSDPLELSVLPRIKMWNILINLPIGLNETELHEVFDNDLNFDNSGNVDYMGIINSDIFVALEAKMLRERALQINRELDNKKGVITSPNDTIEEIEQMLSGRDKDD